MGAEGEGGQALNLSTVQDRERVRDQESPARLTKRCPEQRLHDSAGAGRVVVLTDMWHSSVEHT